MEKFKSLKVNFDLNARVYWVLTTTVNKDVKKLDLHLSSQSNVLNLLTLWHCLHCMEIEFRLKILGQFTDFWLFQPDTVFHSKAKKGACFHKFWEGYRCSFS